MQALDVLALDNLFIGSPARCLLARTADVALYNLKTLGVKSNNKSVVLGESAVDLAIALCYTKS